MRAPLSARPHIIRIVQAILVLAADQWTFAIFNIVQERLVEHRQWLGAALIMPAVGFFNLVSAALLRRAPGM